jgi:hypothetical protein
MKTSLSFLAILICCSWVVGQEKSFPYAEAVTFLGTENHSKVLKKAVFSVQQPGNRNNKGKDDDWISHGSGFIVKGESNTLFGITCYHVVEPIFAAKSSIYVGLDTKKGYHRFFSTLVHSSKELDIAVLGVIAEPDYEVESVYFPLDILGDSTAIVEGRGVLITGYPLSLGVSYDSHHPVVRSGMIAQYTGNDYFLVDGFASHGNSGSPVFSLTFKNAKLVGMVTSFQSEVIQLFDEQNRRVATLPYNSGLARVLSASHILNAVKKADEIVGSITTKIR